MTIEDTKSEMRKISQAFFNAGKDFRNHLEVISKDLYDLIGDFIIDRGDFQNNDFVVRDVNPANNKMDLIVEVDLLDDGGRIIDRFSNTINGGDLLMYIRKYGHTLMYTVCQWNEKPKAVIFRAVDEEVNFEDSLNKAIA